MQGKCLVVSEYTRLTVDYRQHPKGLTVLVPNVSSGIVVEISNIENGARTVTTLAHFSMIQVMNPQIADTLLTQLMKKHLRYGGDQSTAHAKIFGSATDNPYSSKAKEHINVFLVQQLGAEHVTMPEGHATQSKKKHPDGTPMQQAIDYVLKPDGMSFVKVMDDRYTGKDVCSQDLKGKDPEETEQNIKQLFLDAHKHVKKNVDQNHTTHQFLRREKIEKKYNPQELLKVDKDSDKQQFALLLKDLQCSTIDPESGMIHGQGLSK